jgi:DNA-binding NarL/FixJ family response regulator
VDLSAPASFGPDDAALADWPLTRARLLLAGSTWLRRQRRTAAARDARTAAEEIFTELGATAFLAPAAGDAAGSGRVDELTGQESQVAELAAAGLSNREIGERLFMSPRTVSTHLYRVFPKLGITSRADLAAALADADDVDDVDDADR